MLTLGVASSIQLTCTVTPTYIGLAWQYNSMNQLTEIDTDQQNGGVPQPFSYVPTASTMLTRYHFTAGQNNGQIWDTEDIRLGYQVQYAYDALKRVTQAHSTGNGPNAFTEDYSYDGFGNLTATHLNNNPPIPQPDPNTNRLLGVTYDANGNPQTSGAFTLAYDTENRIVSATSGSASATYAYDPSNHRIEETIAGNPGDGQIYFYGPDGKLRTTFSSLHGMTERIYLGNLFLGTTNTNQGSEKFAIADRVGSGRPTTPYGTDISGVDNTWALSADDFATYMWDSFAGLEYANQRWYSPGIGRFLTPDRKDSSAHIEDPSTLNRFSYAAGDPVNHNDPEGLDSQVCNQPDGNEGENFVPSCYISVDVSASAHPVDYDSSNPDAGKNVDPNILYTQPFAPWAKNPGTGNPGKQVPNPTESSLPEIDPFKFQQDGEYSTFVKCEYTITGIDINENPEAWIIPVGATTISISIGVRWLNPYIFAAASLAIIESRMLLIRQACNDQVYGHP